MVVMPFVLMAMGIALFVVVCVMMAPLLPFAAAALIVWAIVRASRPAYV